MITYETLKPKLLNISVVDYVKHFLFLMSKKLSAQPLKESELREIESIKPLVKEKVTNCILTSYESKRLDAKSFVRNVCRLGHKVISIEIDENGIGISLFLTNHVESMFVIYYEWSELKEMV